MHLAPQLGKARERGIVSERTDREAPSTGDRRDRTDPLTAVLKSFREPANADFGDAWVGMEPTFQTEKSVRKWAKMRREARGRGRLLPGRLHAQDAEEGRQGDQEEVRGWRARAAHPSACSRASSWKRTSISGRCGGRTCSSTGPTTTWSRSRSASPSTPRRSSTASSRCRWPGSTTSASSASCEEFLWEVPLDLGLSSVDRPRRGAVLALGQDVPGRQPAGRRHRHQAQPSRAGDLDHGLAQLRRPRVPRHAAALPGVPRRARAVLGRRASIRGPSAR